MSIHITAPPSRIDLKEEVKAYMDDKNKLPKDLPESIERLLSLIGKINKPVEISPRKFIKPAVLKHIAQEWINNYEKQIGTKLYNKII